MSDNKVPQITRPGLHTSPASIAAALRRAADDLDRLGHVQISPIAVQINLQAVCYQGSVEQRKDAVDALALALVGEHGETETGDNPHHRLNFDQREARGDLSVAVYTAVEDYTPGRAR